ncbi:ribokinase [Paraburkholderia susongensis]|uniref:Ribokinase n=1 Tax=Paraburkholderia susongensis TaxID=1515439 RepID=A0A1X7M202_9BURK|nr:ribokinase [Paraburkholderia susongensis]SMG59563.1 ribokinase [Paraburkholderia susongensis]
MNTPVNNPQSENTSLRRVIVVGSVNEDIVVNATRLPVPGETVSGTAIERLQGGKGANQAVASARAGATVFIVAAVGNDDAGRAAVADLAANGVDTSHVWVDNTAPTGTAVVSVSADGENSIVVVPGANATLNSDFVSAALLKLNLRHSDIVVLGFEVPDEVVLGAARVAQISGAQIALNPSPVREVPQELYALRPIVVANEGEAKALTGTASVEDAIRQLLSQTRAPVVITMGEKGAIFASASSAAFSLAPALKVKPVDTTGAGDTFMGVVCASLAAGDNLQDATRHAAVAASLAVTKLGARASSPHASEIANALESVPA